MTRYSLSLALLLAVSAAPALAGERESQVVRSSTDVLEEIMEIPERGIPVNLLRSANAVAVIPNVIKAGFIVGGRHGRGVIVLKERNGAWSNPLFMSLTGASVGWQVGAQSTDLVLVFRNRRSVDRFLRGGGKFTLGGDASVAAGPVGRDTSAATDLRLQAEILTYSRNRGLFAGVALDGTAMKIDWVSIEHYYDTGDAPLEDILAGRNVRVPGSALELRAYLQQITDPKPTPPPASP